MDTLNFSFFAALDDSLETAQGQFARREFTQALATLSRLPPSLFERSDALQLKASSLQALGRLPEAVGAWEALLRVEPNHKLAQKRLAEAHAKLSVEHIFADALAWFRRDKPAEALEALQGVPAEWRQHPEYFRIQAKCHERRAEYTRALESWEIVNRLIPGDPESAVRVPMCRAWLGRVDEARLGFHRAVEKFPKSMFAHFNLLAFEIKQEGVKAALPSVVRDIALLRAISSDSPEFRTQLAIFKERLLALASPKLLMTLDPENVLQLSAESGGAPASLRSVYEEFEPIGNNCEFGQAQRRHSAEPLSLFRWTSVSPANLVRLLRGGFSDFDVPSHYRLEANAASEYLLKEDVYGTSSHTRIHVADVTSTESLLGQLARRQSFLKRKFLETLSEGRKIFVYKSDQPLSSETMDQVQDALTDSGAKKVLFVLPADLDNPGGSVHIATESGRAIGFLSDFMPNVQYDEWDAIVTRAYVHYSKAESPID